ncbi:class I SAM-dependent methyltransferase [candidate division KSB1 bacterium]|nr:class I SAM-dependent methyltransferase [candidate division KSB1 bacterium]
MTKSIRPLHDKTETGKLTNSFDEKAKHWDDDPMKLKRAAAIADGIRSKITIKPQMKALEYGCGTGLLSFQFQTELSHITLADSSDGMLEVLEHKIAVHNIENMTPIKLDLLTDPLPSKRFSVIYTMMTLHHVADIDAILKKFYQLLEDDGVVCIADLDKEDGSFHGHGFDGHHGFDRTELGEKARNVGFRDVDFMDVFQIHRDNSGSIKNYSIFLMTGWK